MTVRSRRLAAGSSGIGSDHVVFTVPADRTAIIKELTLYVTNAVVASFYVNPASGVGVYALLLTAGVADSLTRVDGMFAVLQEGDELHVYAVAGGSHQWSASGALLLGDPV